MTSFRTIPLLALAILSSCSPGAKRPSDADIAAYLAQSEPEYLQVSGVLPTMEPITTLDGKDLPAGSWRVSVTYNLHTTQDLFAPQPGTKDSRAAFDRTVAAAELMRLPRIEATNELAMRIGLMRQGDAAPEPAVAVVAQTKANQDLTNHATLLAKLDGTRWIFTPIGNASLTDEAIGVTVADLHTANPHTVFVMAGSNEDKAYRAREARFLAALAKTSALP